MSRLTVKMDKVRDQISNLEDELERLHEVQNKRNFKKDRKRYRKNYTKNMMTYRFMKQFEGLMFNGNREKHFVFNGIGAQIKCSN